MSVTSRVVLVGAVVAALMSVAAPAQAAKKACVLGKWRGTSYSMIIQGPVGETFGEGARGVRLTITRTSLAYDFNKSTRETQNASSLGSPIFRWWVKYTKKLRVKATVKGSKKGSVVLKHKTATGDATSTTTQTWPEHKNFGTDNMAKNLRAGTAEYVVPVKSTFTCSGKTLKFFSSYKDRDYLVSIGRVFARA